MAITHSLKDLFRRQVLGKSRAEKWPFISGPYYVLDETSPVIVVMPDNNALATDLAALSVQGLCMITSVCRSVSDIEKLTRNVEANLAIHCIVLAGGEEGKNYPAVEALRAIFGDDNEKSAKAEALAHRVRGKLKSHDFDALKKRVGIVDLLTCSDIDKLITAINKYSSEGIRPDTGFVVQSYDSTIGIQRVIAPTNISDDFRPDKAGSFVIGTDNKSIIVEQFNSKGELLRLIEGKNARNICIMLIRNGWVSRLDHAAFLGRELTLAELAVQRGESYEQSPPARADENPSPADKKE